MLGDFCQFRYPILYLAGPLVLVASLAPLLWGRAIRGIFDPHLNQEKYWGDAGQTQLFFSHIRAAVYLAALGNRKLGRRRFPGADLESIAPKGLRPFAVAYGFCLLVGTSLSVLGGFFVVFCGRL